MHGVFDPRIQRFKFYVFKSTKVMIILYIFVSKRLITRTYKFMDNNAQNQ